MRRRRNPLRRAIKHFYLENMLREIRGRTVDFGFGAGQLLERLPPGSLGLEVNPDLVEDAQRASLNAKLYDGDMDPPLIGVVEPGTYSTLVMAHVLEHVEHADGFLRRLLRSCAQLDIQRVIVVVPGAKGFQFDSTHRTFVTARYVADHGLQTCEGYSLTTTRYFPGNREWIGRYYVFHETMFVFDRGR
jgi:hypothetical protein